MPKCSECGGADFEAVDDGDGSSGGAGEGLQMCLDCGHEQAIGEAGEGKSGEEDEADGTFAHYVCGRVSDIELGPMKGTKVSRVELDLGGGKTAQIATTSKTTVGHVVVAILAGGTIACGKDKGTKVTKKAVAGVNSDGMLCDSDMVGWSGGAKGVVARVNDWWELGAAPPTNRPRLDAPAP